MNRKNLNEMAAAYGKCSKTFRKYVRALKIPHIRLGRDMLFDPEQVERFLEEMTRSQDNPPPDLKAKLLKKPRSPRAAAASSRFAEMLGL